MKILSLDASTKSTGVAIFDNNKLIAQECITSTSMDLFKRIHVMIDRIRQLLFIYQIDKIILEEVRPENGLANIKTHKALMYLQGAIAMLVHDNYPHTEIVYLYPNEWRKLCGIKTGSGIKRESLKAKDINFVKDKFNLDVNDDIADAIGLGYAYLKQQGIKDELNWE